MPGAFWRWGGGCTRGGGGRSRGPPPRGGRGGGGGGGEATYLVAPDFRGEVVAFAVGRGLPVVPGALTPTEVVAAWGAGATAVKVFPVSAVGGVGDLEAGRGAL